MLAGIAAWVGQGDDFRERTIAGERPDRSILRPDAPPALVALLEQLWAQDPAARPTAAEVVVALTEILRVLRLEAAAAP